MSVFLENLINSTDFPFAVDRLSSRVRVAVYFLMGVIRECKSVKSFLANVHKRLLGLLSNSGSLFNYIEVAIDLSSPFKYDYRLLGLPTSRVSL